MMKSWSAGPPNVNPKVCGAAVPRQPLNGASFLVVESLGEVMDMNTLLERLGGNRVFANSSRAACVLTSRTAVADESNRTRLEGASNRGVPLVLGKDWLLACLNSRKMLPFDSFTLSLPTSPPLQPQPQDSDASDESLDAVIVEKPCSDTEEEDESEREEEEEERPRVCQPSGLPPGASDRPLLAKHGAARPVPVSGKGFVRGITREELMDMSRTVLDYRILHNCHMAENKNKYYVIELSDDHKITTHYGRTDDLEQDPNSGRREVRTFRTAQEARGYFVQLLTEKYNVKHYKDVALKSSLVGTKQLQKVVSDRFHQGKGSPTHDLPPARTGPYFNQRKNLLAPVLEVVDKCYDEANKTLSAVLTAKITKNGILTPLGVLADEQIKKGDDILDQLHVLITSGGSATKQLMVWSSEFYTCIPHKLGRGEAEVAVKTITKEGQLTEKRELLQLMRDMNNLSSAAGQSEAELKYRALNCELVPLNPAVEEYSDVRKVVETQERNVGLKVKRAFRLTRAAEHERFAVDIPGRTKLLHASKPECIAGILSRGLLLPRKVVDAGGSRTNYGWLGSGVYFSDRGCTASRYTRPTSDGIHYIFVATVALGKTKMYTTQQPQLTEPPPEYHSVLGAGKDMPGGPAQSDFIDNEYVVFGTDRFTLDYLLECSIAKPLPLLEPPRPIPAQESSNVPMQSVVHTRSSPKGPPKGVWRSGASSVDGGSASIVDEDNKLTDFGVKVIESNRTAIQKLQQEVSELQRKLLSPPAPAPFSFSGFGGRPEKPQFGAETKREKNLASEAQHKPLGFGVQKAARKPGGETAASSFQASQQKSVEFGGASFGGKAVEEHAAQSGFTFRLTDQPKAGFGTFGGTSGFGAQKASGGETAAQQKSGGASFGEKAVEEPAAQSGVFGGATFGFGGLHTKQSCGPQSLLNDNERLKQVETDLRRRYAKLDRSGGSVQPSPYEFLLAIYAPACTETFAFQPLTPEEEAGGKLLQQYVRGVTVGQPSIVPREKAEANLEEILGGQLDGLRWDNVFVAGGAVLGALLPDNAGNGCAFRGTDLDLFVHGVFDDEKANGVLKHIIETVKKNRGKPVQLLRTPHAVTILGEYPFRHVQVVLRVYSSPSEVLVGFDVDACTVGYDGTRFWANPRARRAINKQINTVDLSRRSLTYEVRLAKYAKRGFAVLVPRDVANLTGLATTAATKHATGLEKLFCLDRDESRAAAAAAAASASRKMHRWRRKGKAKSRGRSSSCPQDLSGSTDDEKNQIPDYSSVFVPWGPSWHSWLLRRRLDKKDKAQYFAEGGEHHRHIACTSVGDDVLSGYTDWCIQCAELKRNGGTVAEDDLGCPYGEAQGKYVYGKVTWMWNDPGRQLMTGSFHPVSDDKWAAFGNNRSHAPTRPFAVPTFKVGANPVSGGVEPEKARDPSSCPAVNSRVLGGYPNMCCHSLSDADELPHDSRILSLSLWGNMTMGAALTFTLPSARERLEEEAKSGARIVFVCRGDCPSEVCSAVFAAMGETSRKRAVVLAAGQGSKAPPNPLVFDLFLAEVNGAVVPGDMTYVGPEGRLYRDYDYKFAVNCGMRYETPEGFFNMQPSGGFPAQNFDPETCRRHAVRRWITSTSTCRSRTDVIPERVVDEPRWLVMLIGMPGSGKSAFCNRYLSPKGFVCVSRDVLGSADSCRDVARRAFLANASVAVDNLNASVEDRKSYVALARKYGYKVAAIHLKTPEAVAKHMNALRPWKGASSVPDVVYNMYKRNFEDPTASEGFDEVHEVPFVPEFDNPMDEKYFFLLPC